MVRVRAALAAVVLMLTAGCGGNALVQNANSTVTADESAQLSSEAGRGMSITEYPVPAPGVGNGAIVQTPDGSVYFTAIPPYAAGRYAAGKFSAVSAFDSSNPGAYTQIAFGPDGAIYAGKTGAAQTVYVDHIVGVSNTGETLVDVNGGPDSLLDLAPGGDGRLWAALEFGGPPYANIYSISDPGTPRATSKRSFTRADSFSTSITGDPNGGVWVALNQSFGALNSSTIFALERAGVQGHVFDVPGHPIVRNLIVGPDDALWFVQNSSGKTTIGRMTFTGRFKTFTLSPPHSPVSIAAAGNAIWFTDSADEVGRITMGGNITEYALPVPNGSPSGIAGPARTLDRGVAPTVWFTDGQHIGRITVH